MYNIFSKYESLFLASVNVNESLRDSYAQIIEIFEKNDTKVSSKHSLVTANEIEKLDQESNEIRAKKLLKEMLNSDCVVFEGTTPTAGGGYYLYAALQKGIPVLYLSQEEYKGLYLASASRLLQIKKYEKDDNSRLEKIITDFIKFINKKRLSNRFNLMISESMDEYLNKVSKDYGTSKADFIRDIVYKKMENEK